MARFVSQEELIGVLERFQGLVPRVVFSGNFASPAFLLRLVNEALESFRLFTLNPQKIFPIKDGVELETPFVGPAFRERSDCLSYIPMRLSLVPRLLRTNRKPEIVLLNVSRVIGGKVSLGIEVNLMVAAIEEARRIGAIVIAQINSHMPYTYGDGEIDLERIDYCIYRDEPIPSPGEVAIDDTAAAIGTNVAQLVKDGSTLQLGIGAIPNAALAALKDRRYLRIWSEMFSDGVLELEKVGALDHGVPIVASFIFGSEELYNWVDMNPRVQMRRTEVTNDPSLIARNPQMTSINTAVQVDLYAQANASFVRDSIYSGFGGQTDFIVGALHSVDGNAIIALPSWHLKSGTSTVIDKVQAPVTSFQHSALVTEWGVASIFGKSQSEQATEIIERIAHPSARDYLREAAARMNLH
ncbi:MAG: 4-hydroxybutyrate CoA-transferase [Actinomycetota bacterium]|nr:4-hydroxybutyrate CoA-transferase [Actinomycetota bacterium]